MKKNFNWRAFTTLYIVFSFIIITFSGLILFIAPPGRIANWMQTGILGLSKQQWQNIHTIITFLFIIAAGFHIYFNWKPLIFYLKGKIRAGKKIHKELISVSLITSLISVMAIHDFPPFNAIMAFGESIKHSWSTQETEPPIPHIELMTIEEIAQYKNLKINYIKDMLATSNIYNISNDILLKDLAATYRMSPKDIYNLLDEKVISDNMISKSQTGRGYGWKTIAELAVEFDQPVTEIVAKLKSKGFEANAQSRLKDLARQYRTNPHFFLQFIQHQ